MLAEALSIIAIMLLMIGISFRGGKRKFAYLILPFLIVPGSYLIAKTVDRFFKSVFSIPSNEVGAIIVAIGMVIACVLFGMLANYISHKRARISYIIMCIGFTVAFGWLFIRSFLF